MVHAAPAALPGRHAGRHHRYSGAGGSAWTFGKNASGDCDDIQPKLTRAAGSNACVCLHGVVSLKAFFITPRRRVDGRPVGRAASEAHPPQCTGLAPCCVANVPLIAPPRLCMHEREARAQVDGDMVAEVAKLGFDRDMVVDSLRKRQQNKARPARGTSRAAGRQHGAAQALADSAGLSRGAGCQSRARALSTIFGRARRCGGQCKPVDRAVCLTLLWACDTGRASQPPCEPCPSLRACAGGADSCAGSAAGVARGHQALQLSTCHNPLFSGGKCPPPRRRRWRTT